MVILSLPGHLPVEPCLYPESGAMSGAAPPTPGLGLSRCQLDLEYVLEGALGHGHDPVLWVALPGLWPATHQR